ncbi:MAG: hypothetical protein EP297_13245 [Gammaproteobacteria bacterium]|nr:MAG: hypothetical protein EP297_13245 [Gammaproteobacteria bacterium]
MKLFSQMTVILVTAGLFSTNVQAVDVLAVCGGSNGYSYFPERGLVPVGKGGWQKDQISSGTITFIRTDEGKVDLIYKTAAGVTTSPSQEGGNVATLYEDTERLVVLSFFQGVVTETFYLNKTNQELLWNQIKYNSQVEKAAAFVSNCGPGK